VASKTVTRMLTDEQAADYQGWFDNAKTLRTLTNELEALSLAIVEEDPTSVMSQDIGDRCRKTS
jgi:hypothetical protein